MLEIRKEYEQLNFKADMLINKIPATMKDKGIEFIEIPGDKFFSIQTKRIPIQVGIIKGIMLSPEGVLLVTYLATNDRPDTTAYSNIKINLEEKIKLLEIVDEELNK